MSIGFQFIPTPVLTAQVNNIFRFSFFILITTYFDSNPFRFQPIRISSQQMQYIFKIFVSSLFFFFSEVIISMYSHSNPFRLLRNKLACIQHICKFFFFFCGAHHSRDLMTITDFPFLFS